MEELNLGPSPQESELRKVPPRFFPKVTAILPIFIIVVVVAAGVLTGLVLASRSKYKASSASAAIEGENLNEEQKQSVQTVTRDQAEGTIEKNDKFEETAQGQWKLIRPGGESQTAFLTSSYLDLDEYVGKKVKVYGETLGSDKVGWLMDVAKVEVID